MKNWLRRVLAITLCIFTLCATAACKAPKSASAAYGLSQFEQDMKAAHYSFTVKNSDRFFLPAAQKRMAIGKDSLIIYIFSSAAIMQKTAKGINSDGYIYSDGDKSVCVDYFMDPHLHFFKKGSIIVEYAGVNKKLLVDLNKLLGAQFAGEES